MKSRYETVPSAKLDVDYWDCPYCGYQNDDVDAIRRHITQHGGDHEGHSGHYPDDIIYGYRDGVQIGLITPANRDDPNDESVILAYDVPAVSDPQLVLLEDAETAKANAQEALAELGIDYSLTDQVLAAVLQLDPATIDESRSLLEQLPPIVRERARSKDRIVLLELALGAHVAGELRSGFVLRAFAATEATTATPSDIPDGPLLDAVKRQLTSVDKHDIRKRTENGTVYFRVIPATPSDSYGGVPPEPELAAIDTTELAEIQESLDDLEDLLERERAETGEEGRTTVKLEQLEKAKEFLAEKFGVQVDRE